MLAGGVELVTGGVSDSEIAMQPGRGPDNRWIKLRDRDEVRVVDALGDRGESLGDGASWPGLLATGEPTPPTATPSRPTAEHPGAGTSL